MWLSFRNWWFAVSDKRKIGCHRRINPRWKIRECQPINFEKKGRHTKKKWVLDERFNRVYFFCPDDVHYFYCFVRLICRGESLSLYEVDELCDRNILETLSEALIIPGTGSFHLANFPCNFFASGKLLEINKFSAAH